MSIHKELDAKHYQENSKIQKILASSVLALHKVRPDEIVLDLGCGDGAITCEISLLTSQGEVLGKDPSKNMIDFANSSFPNSLFKNLSFEFGYAENSHGDNYYTLITALNCLHWAKNLTRAFQQTHKALVTGGKMLILTYPCESAYWSAFIEVLARTEWYHLWPNSICDSWLSSDAYLALIQKIGFKVLHKELITESIIYKDKNAFKNYVNGWLPCLLKTSENNLAKYLEEVTHLVWEKYGNQIPYTKLQLYLEK